jgi:hypothetical protein
MKVYFDPSEVAELIRPHVERLGIGEAMSHDETAIRAAFTILNQPGGRCELRRVDRIFTAMGRPDLMALLTEV